MAQEPGLSPERRGKDPREVPAEDLLYVPSAIKSFSESSMALRISRWSLPTAMP